MLGADLADARPCVGARGARARRHGAKEDRMPRTRSTGGRRHRHSWPRLGLLPLLFVIVAATACTGPFSQPTPTPPPTATLGPTATATARRAGTPAAAATPTRPAVTATRPTLTPTR